MKYGMSSLLGPGLAGALLLGSGCIVITEGKGDGDHTSGPSRITLSFAMPSGESCILISDNQDRTCDSAIAPLDKATVVVTAEWGARTPGSIEVSDDCGGTFVATYSKPDWVKGQWAPPSTEGTCVITARAISADGGGMLISGVVAVKAEEPQPAPYPRVSGKLSHSNDTCVLAAGETAVFCSEPVRAGDVIQASIDIDWGNLTEIQKGVSSSCGGESVEPVNDGSSFQAAWRAPLIDTKDCWVAFEAMTEEGPATIATLYYSVVDGQPRGEVYAYVYFEHSGGQCYLNPGAVSSDCAPATAGERTLVYVEIDWGNHEAGSITVDDTCNGSFTNTFSSSTNKSFDWVVPPAPTTCTVQVEAITASGERNVFEMNIPID